MKGDSAESGVSSMRDLLDNAVLSGDDQPLARVGDVRLLWEDDGTLRVDALLFGPQTLAGRVSLRLQRIFRGVLHDRLERVIDLAEVEKMGDPIRVRGQAADYRLSWVERSPLAHVIRVTAGPKW